MRQALGPGALGKPRGSGWRGKLEGGLGWGTHVNPWLFHFNVWQNPLQEKKKVDFLLNSLVCSPCCPRDFQEPSPAPYFKSINARLSVFFMVQLSHPYMTTGKIIALARQTFVGKVISLLFNTLSRLVIVFFLRSKHLLISWLQPLSAVILELKKIKIYHCFQHSLSLCHEVMGLDALILVFWMLS